VSYKSSAVLVAVLFAAGLAAQPAAAQPYSDQPYPPQSRYPSPDYGNAARPVTYEDGYRAGYRAGYRTGQLGGRYNEVPPRIGAVAPVDPNQRWRQRYGQTYTYNDDQYYQQCRNAPDPAGVIAGAIIGGLLGNAAGRGGARAATTVGGVIVGGALGAALTSHLDCSDRSYAYKTYYDGFNSGRPHSNWQWDNPDNGHYGDFRVGDYYTDQDGFRCATYTQQIYVQGMPQTTSGQACQQPDGTWTIVS
jgi:surface antigen